MNQKQITAFIFDLFEQKGSLPENLEDKLSFRYLDEGIIDSMALIHFIMQIEEQFEIELTPEDTQSDEFRTVGGLINLITQKKRE